MTTSNTAPPPNAQPATGAGAANLSSAIAIDSAFDSGNIEVVSVAGNTAHLSITHDHDSAFYQWFHFRVSGAAGRELVLKIGDLNNSAYPAGWLGYRAAVSEDRQFWGRAPTTFDKEEGTGHAHDPLLRPLPIWPGSPISPRIPGSGTRIWSPRPRRARAWPIRALAARTRGAPSIA